VRPEVNESVPQHDSSRRLGGGDPVATRGRSPRPGLLLSSLVVTAGIGVLGVAGVLGGWVWPLVFLLGAVVAGVLLGRRPWLVVGMLAATMALLTVPDGAVRFVGTLWMWVAAHVGAAVLVAGVRRWGSCGGAVLWGLGVLLPRGEREFWRAEVRSVLHACGDDREVRRQVVGFLAAVPATVVTSWRVRP
jgi:hypothetical protein